MTARKKLANVSEQMWFRERQCFANLAEGCQMFRRRWPGKDDVPKQSNELRLSCQFFVLVTE